MQGWSRHRVASLGAALAYYSVFSLGPLLLIVTATAGILFGENAVRGELTNQFRGLLGPTGGQAIDAMLKGAANPQTGTLAAVTGVVLLLVTAVAVVVQLKEALNTIWEVDTAAESGWRPYLHTYLVSFAGILGLGFLLAVSLVINAMLAAGASTLRVSGTEAVLWEALNFSVSLIVLAALFGLLFKWFPDTDVSWSEVVPGAVATAILFNLGKMAIGWYIGREGLESTYGAAASIVVLLIWAYYSAQILLFGAELTHAYARNRRGLPLSPAHSNSPSYVTSKEPPMGQLLSSDQIEELAAKHGVSPGAVENLAAAMVDAGGAGAQFSHPELGGMGQWMPSGMLMIGDMFNHQLKAKVDHLCRDVAQKLSSRPLSAVHESVRPSSSAWWPAELGSPASTGSQNEMRYAFFPQAHRLAIFSEGALALYDTGEHRITGFSQQQASTGTLAFTSPEGAVPLSKLRRLSG